MEPKGLQAQTSYSRLANPYKNLLDVFYSHTRLQLPQVMWNLDSQKDSRISAKGFHLGTRCPSKQITHLPPHKRQLG